jgi:hypothetical protein
MALMVHPARARRLARQRRFLRAFETLGTVTHAATQAGIHRDSHYSWLTADPAYVKAFADAVAVYADRLEREADRRAVEGVQRPVYQDGQVVGHVTEYSDRLLELRLKAVKPEVYRERTEARHSVQGLPDGLWEEVLRRLRPNSNIPAAVGAPPAG